MSNEPVETEQVGKYTVKVFYDDTGCNEPFDCDMPNTWGIDLSNHRDYKSPTYGDSCPFDYINNMGKEPEDMDSDAQQELSDFNRDYVWLPVYMYSHSGRTVRTYPFSCKWDSGCAGIVYMSKAEAAKEGITDIEEWLTSTVKELDYHMTGQVYGYIVENEDGDELDSCWGFVGEIEYCMEEGKSTAQYYVNLDVLMAKARESKRLKKLKVLIRNRVPLQYREMELRRAH